MRAWRSAISTTRTGCASRRARGGTDTFYINRYFEVDVPPAERLGETGSGVKTKYYYFGDRRVAMRSLNVLTTLHADHLGSTVAATQGGATNAHKYKAFGANRSAGDVHTDHLFTGQKQDGTGLLYYRAPIYGARYIRQAVGHVHLAGSAGP